MKMSMAIYSVSRDMAVTTLALLSNSYLILSECAFLTDSARGTVLERFIPGLSTASRDC